MQGRKQEVVVGQGFSDWDLVTSGVPQGSVLGPTLLYTYVNELPNLIQSNIKMFADDVKLYRIVCGRQATEQLQKDIEALEHWSNIWLLRLNPLKCKVMHCGQRSQRCYQTAKRGTCTPEVHLDFL